MLIPDPSPQTIYCCIINCSFWLWSWIPNAYFKLLALDCSFKLSMFLSMQWTVCFSAEFGLLMVCHPKAVEIKPSVYWAPSPLATTTASSSNSQSLAHWGPLPGPNYFRSLGVLKPAQQIPCIAVFLEVDCRVSGPCQLKFLCHMLTPCHLSFTCDNHKYYTMYLPSRPLSVSTTRFLHLISQHSNFLSTQSFKLTQRTQAAQLHPEINVFIVCWYWNGLVLTWLITDTTPGQDKRCIKEFWTESEHWSLYSYLYTVLTLNYRPKWCDDGVLNIQLCTFGP